MTAPVRDPCFDIPSRPARNGDRIRVVELLATGSAGGAQEHVHALVTGLQPDRYDVQVVSLSEGSATRRLRAAGIPVAIVSDADDGAAARSLAALLSQRPPDVLHNHMFRAEVVGTRAALALSEAGFPKPYVVSTVHSSRVRSAEDRALLRALTPHMDRLLAVSKAIVGKLESEGRGSADAGKSGPRIDLVYNGVDLNRYSEQEACCTLPEEYGFPEGVPLVGVVARLEPEKGHATLLEAWPKVLRDVPQARLLVIGEGSRRAELEAQAEALGLLGDPCEGDACVGTRRARPGAKVIFTDTRDDVPAVTAALDVAVLPSYREAQGLAILEAMALRRPVVATRVGGIPEVIDDGHTGLLVPPHDADALARAIVRLLTDHPLADTLARAGHDLVYDRFCVERMVESIEAIYDEGAAEVAARSGNRSASA
jgi:glycosyltransferase involved in cell wall biosynthesis